MVVGISAEGWREVLVVLVADLESNASWGEVFSNILNHTAVREKAFVLGVLKSITEAPTLIVARKALPEVV